MQQERGICRNILIIHIYETNKSEKSEIKQQKNWLYFFSIVRSVRSCKGRRKWRRKIIVKWNENQVVVRSLSLAMLFCDLYLKYWFWKHWKTAHNLWHWVERSRRVECTSDEDWPRIDCFWDGLSLFFDRRSFYFNLTQFSLIIILLKFSIDLQLVFATFAIFDLIIMIKKSLIEIKIYDRFLCCRHLTLVRHY